jgi:hypothetical protein
MLLGDRTVWYSKTLVEQLLPAFGCPNSIGIFVLERGVIGGDRRLVQLVKQQRNVCLQKVHNGLSGLRSPRSGSPIVRIHALMSA